MPEIAADARAKIERYLGRVEEHLAGLPDEESEEILRDVDAHIRDAIDRRAPDGATAEDVTAVLDEMDPPASWGIGPLSKPRPAAAPAPAPAPRDLTVPVLALAAITALFLGFAAAWISGPDAGGAPGFALVAAALLGGAAVVIGAIRWNARAAAEPARGRDTLGGASFALLLVTVSLTVVAIIAAATWPSYPYSFYSRTLAEQELLRERLEVIRDLHEAVVIAGIVLASLALLFAWVFGRIALAAAPDRPAPAGWKRVRAQLAPGLCSAALLLGIFGFLPVLVFAIGSEEIFRRHGESVEIPSSVGLAVAFLMALLVLFGVLLRFSPGAIHAVFSPLTDRLAPRHWRGFLLAAAVFLVLGVAFIAIYSSAAS